MAKKACDLNLVSINGKIAKASTIAQADDEVRYTVYNWRYTIKITDIPKGNVSKVTAPQYYELLKKKEVV